jgi:phosphatidylserine/phosphatidylglycerophosphate/cardiolipin synthase-like enzyme
VSNTKLATIFHKFIDWDFERSNEKPEAGLLEALPLPELFVMEAEVLERGERFMYFPSRKFVFTRNNPLKVQPVLSPDNYMEHAKKVIKSATSKLYFQNQYINIASEITDEYDELLRLLAAKTNDDSIDCRIILRKPFSTADKMEMFNNLKEYGFNMSKVKLMKNTHTKGIIADGKRIMLGSHNWSNSGVEFNRDASLVIYNEDVAGYYEDIFVHDWERRTIRESADEEETMEIEGNTESSLLENNFKPIDWESYFE